MFNCPDNYEEFLKEREWNQWMESKHRKYTLKTFPILYQVWQHAI